MTPAQFIATLLILYPYCREHKQHFPHGILSVDAIQFADTGSAQAMQENSTQSCKSYQPSACPAVSTGPHFAGQKYYLEATK